MEKLEFKKGDHILQALSASDQKLALLIDKIGDYTLTLRTDYFPSLVRSIIGQQLSVSAVSAIWLRTADLCKDFCPEIIAGLPEEAFKTAGLSKPKISYIKELSQKIICKELDFETLCTLPNADIINRLTQVKGIGIWTVEMFLIFSLGRLDVLSVGDAGLRRSIQWLYKLKTPPAERTIKILGKKWAPYQTVASLYLWEVINQGFIKDFPNILFPLLLY
jgi:DNA-3-methyladenine glycosylase II